MSEYNTFRTLYALQTWYLVSDASQYHDAIKRTWLPSANSISSSSDFVLTFDLHTQNDWNW